MGEAGLRTVPVIVRGPVSEKDKLELAIIENVQRADLSPIERARAFAQLQDEFRLTQREIASRMGKSRELVANSLRLLSLPTEIQDALASRKISESQARPLLAVEDIQKQLALFEEILHGNLSVREIKARLRSISSSTGDAEVMSMEVTQIPSMDPEALAIKERLEEFLGTRVDLVKTQKGGKISIGFYSPEELAAILEKILKRNE